MSGTSLAGRVGRAQCPPSQAAAHVATTWRWGEAMLPLMSDQVLPPDCLRDWLGEIDIYLFDQVLRNRIRPGMAILDAGCGRGRNLVYFLRCGLAVAPPGRAPPRWPRARCRFPPQRRPRPSERPPREPRGVETTWRAGC